jgi:hydrogenase maturation protease
MTVLVLGIGNILLSDEGVGVRTVEALARLYEPDSAVEMVDGGTCGMDLIDMIAGRDALIVVDAARLGHPPGTVSRLTEGDVTALFRARLSPHQIGFADLLAALTLTDSVPPHIVYFVCEPEALDMGLELSPIVASAVPRLIAGITDELRAWGAPLRFRVSTLDASRSPSASRPA